jgi:hypothetical protein
MRKLIILVTFGIALLSFGLVQGADIIPDVIKLPGTQPEEVTMESVGRCLNCHEGYETNPRVEPGFGWMGAAMGNAGRDPIFWATLTIAEQDFDGAGDLCIRCHSAGGWMAGRSTPTDGSGLAASDDDGIDCDTCHQMTNPDMAEHVGTMNDPFIANQGDSLTEQGALEAYYGSGMYVMSNDYGKLGPYPDGDAVARHQFTESNFHRNVDFCGTCHDVSNSVVGQLAPNAGTLDIAAAPGVIRDGALGAPFDNTLLEDKAAFNNPPYAYGIVERTFSEYKSSPLSSTLVDDFDTLPSDLQDPRGSLYNAYMASTTDGTRSANYVDDATNPDETSKRYFSCQTCHMRAITGRGCDKNNAPNRLDQPMHDQTGGNYWIAPIIQYQDTQGTLRLGGGLTALQIEAMNDGALRAGDHLTQAGTLDVNGDLVRITNMTGHKLISGYPEGRRMWLNIKWYDASGAEIIGEEVGEWGPLGVDITNPKDGTIFDPWSIVDLDDHRLKVYEVHPAITQDWDDTLRTVFTYHENTPIGFNRMSGAIEGTIGDLANGDLGPYAKSFHFVLNNYIAYDNRIPPYQMSYNEALKRNALPVPFDQYGGAPDGVYEHWDEFDIGAMAAAINAASADLTLYYQGTSWEYVQFLYKAAENPPVHAGDFLAEEGVNFLDAWVKTGMVPPYTMATATWGQPHQCIPDETPELTCNDGKDNDCDGLTDCDDVDDCGTDPSCGECTLIEFPACFDGLDNDCDGDFDCADRTDCDGVIETCGLGVCESTGSQCSNGTLIEATCTPLPATEPGSESTCDDGLDNDCDGLTDANDPDCQPAMACSDYTDKGLCNDDPTCEWSGSPRNGSCQDIAVCEPTSTDEIGLCGDGIDNDCDGVTDCNDTADCGADPVCQVTCSEIPDKGACNNDPTCEWIGNPKNGTCTDL